MPGRLHAIDSPRHGATTGPASLAITTSEGTEGRRVVVVLPAAAGPALSS
jgi:hypothetical protein